MCAVCRVVSDETRIKRSQSNRLQHKCLCIFYLTIFLSQFLILYCGHGYNKYAFIINIFISLFINIQFMNAERPRSLAGSLNDWLTHSLTDNPCLSLTHCMSRKLCIVLFICACVLLINRNFALFFLLFTPIDTNTDSKPNHDPTHCDDKSLNDGWMIKTPSSRYNGSKRRDGDGDGEAQTKNPVPRYYSFQWPNSTWIGEGINRNYTYRGRHITRFI